MNNLFRHIVIILLFKIDWRKLLFVGSVITIAVVVVQIYTLPYPLTIWILSPPETHLVYRSFNRNMHFSDKNSLARLESLETHLVQPVIPVNTSNELNQSVPLVDEKGNATRQRGRSSRRRRKHTKPEIILTPPAPPRRPVPHLLLVRSLRS